MLAKSNRIRRKSQLFLWISTFDRSDGLTGTTLASDLGAVRGQLDLENGMGDIALVLTGYIHHVQRQNCCHVGKRNKGISSLQGATRMCKQECYRTHKKSARTRCKKGPYCNRGSLGR